MVKSAYIHIPFCDSICSYCDFCKFLKNDKWVMNYLSALENEIKTVYKGEVLDTIYIGGGTPSSLNKDELSKLFQILKIFKLSKDVEFTFECNIENIDKEKLQILFNNGVNRISIGIQTFNKKHLNYLNRKHDYKMVVDKISTIKQIGFKNINIDLIYALKGQTLKELDNDLKLFLNLDINHISTYSLIIEPNTKLYIEDEKNIDDELDYQMYKKICSTLKNHGYNHYEISNFAIKGSESRHNLVYWNNLEYYGFGLGASGYIDSVRYENTRSINNYLKGIYIKDKHILSEKEKIENEFILGFRKINGINKDEFKNKYNIDVKSIEIVNSLLKERKLLENEKNIYINPEYIYVSNSILVNFIN